MEELVQPDKLRARVKLWANEEITTSALPPKAGVLLDAILCRGALPRSDVAKLLGTSPRSARRVVAALIDRGIVTAATTKSALTIAFPAELAGRWMPGLFPEKTG
jgi:DNA-binding MarR family transcriptional regulator